MVRRARANKTALDALFLGRNNIIHTAIDEKKGIRGRSANEKSKWTGMNRSNKSVEIYRALINCRQIYTAPYASFKDEPPQFSPVKVANQRLDLSAVCGSVSKSLRA